MRIAILLVRVDGKKATCPELYTSFNIGYVNQETALDRFNIDYAIYGRIGYIDI